MTTVSGSMSRRTLLTTAAAAGGGIVLAGVAVVRGGAADQVRGLLQSATPDATPDATPFVGTPTVRTEQPPQLEMLDLVFNPAGLMIPAGTDIEIELINNGLIPHDFNIDELDIHTELVQPGARQMVVVNAAAGEYAYYCSVQGHRQSGMEGILTAG